MLQNNLKNLKDLRDQFSHNEEAISWAFNIRIPNPYLKEFYSLESVFCIARYPPFLESASLLSKCGSVTSSIVFTMVSVLVPYFTWRPIKYMKDSCFPLTCLFSKLNILCIFVIIKANIIPFILFWVAFTLFLVFLSIATGRL